MFFASNEDTRLPGLFAGFSTDGGLTWTTRFMADGSDGLPNACCDPSVSWDTFGNLFLAYLDDAAANTVLVMSTNGGATFSLVMQFTAQDQPKVATGANSVWIVHNKVNS